MNENKGAITKFFKANGFYVVLIICVIAAGVSSYLAIDTLMTQLSTTETPPEITAPIGTMPTQEADTSQSNVPIEEDEQEDETQRDESQAANASTDESVRETQESAQQETDETVPSDDTAQQTQEESQVDKDAVVEPLEFVMPVSGQIIKNFSGDELVFNETMEDWRTHNGIDFEAAIDTPVVSATSGTVKDAYYDDMWGGVLLVAYEGMEIKYAGLNAEMTVKKGDEISAGDAIGRVGEVPCEMVQNPHIHIEVTKTGEYIPFTDLNK